VTNSSLSEWAEDLQTHLIPDIMEQPVPTGPSDCSWSFSTTAAPPSHPAVPVRWSVRLKPRLPDPSHVVTAVTLFSSLAPFSFGFLFSVSQRHHPSLPVLNSASFDC